jgi:uncharacterized repeat protein (TIGR03803 family)
MAISLEGAGAMMGWPNRSPRGRRRPCATQRRARAPTSRSSRFELLEGRRLLTFGFQTLASFNDTDGGDPEGSLTLSADGSTLYGETQVGAEGNVFSIPVTGGTPTVLASFNGTDGNTPYGSLTLIGSTLYGMTKFGGANNEGAIFSVPVTGGTPTLLASFNGTDGDDPQGSLTPSADGSTFYGMTVSGGAHSDGVIFSIPATGGTPSLLASFNGTDGEQARANLTLIGSTLYGMTEQGGTGGQGNIFSIPVTGGTPTNLASLNSTDGEEPLGSLTPSADGSTLYGMTQIAGANSDGTIFSIPVTGGTPTVLASFNGTDGKSADGNLTLSGSTLYGMTSEGGANSDGTIFSIPVTGGTPTTLLSFNGTNGADPAFCSLTLSGPTFYGMTTVGGAHGDGTVFAAGTFFVAASGATHTFTLGGSAVAVDSGVTVTSSTTDITGASIAIANDQSGDSLNYTPIDGITIASNSGGVLTLTGTATPAQYQSALQSVTFSTTSGVGTARSISIVGIDGSADSIPAAEAVDIHIPAPVVTTSGSTGQTFDVGSSAVAVDSGLTVSSPDTDLTGAKMTITVDRSGDTLNFSNQNGISGTFASGVLTLSGSATPAQYQAALQSVTFSTTSTVKGTRTVDVVADDSAASPTTSNTAVDTVVEAISAPVVTASGSTGQTFTLGHSAVAVDSGITASSFDTDLTGATETITNLQSGDTLIFNNQNNITGSYNNGTGVLTLTGSATVANYQTAMRSVTFSSTSTVKGTRTVDVVAEDSNANTTTSGTAVDTVVEAISAPVVTASGSTGQTFTLGGSPVAVDSGITASSFDTDLTGATETITSLQSGDTLIFNNQNNITGSYNNGTGVLTLSGSATVANYQTALQSVTFSSTSTVKGTRTIDVVADDSNDTGNVASNTAVDTVVEAIAAPVVTTSGFPVFSFSGTNGQFPYGSLTLGGSTLYGMTEYGGLNGYGSIFSFPATGGTPATLFSFDATHGAYPTGNLTLSGSTLYGMTPTGGGNGVGTVFSIPVTGGTPTTLFSLTSTTGEYPEGNLTLSGSTLYGMTNSGGTNGDGTVFSIPVTGGTPTVLASLNSTSGENPYGSLTLSGSTLYGMTNAGGTSGDGTIFSVPVTGGTPTVLASFNGTNGENPYGSLTLSGSTLYGMTNAGGADDEGTLFSIPVTGGTPTTLLSFNGTDGGAAFGDLTLSGSTLYGMTAGGGSNGTGAVFSIPLTGGNPTTLLSLTGANGQYPRGGLTLSGSTLYGMAFMGGANSDGTIFSTNALAATVGGPAVAVDSGVAISSCDTDITGASETITNDQSGDTLNFTNQNGISGSYSAGVLTLSGSATPAQYQAALQSVTFSTTNLNTTTRTVDVVADDANDTGNVPSNTGVDTVNVVIAAPVVTPSGTTGTFTLGLSPVAVDSGIDVASADSDVTGASVTINNDQSGDVLNYAPIDGITIASNSGGVLTLTGSATPAQYQAALRSVTFSTTSTVGTARSISIVANDANDTGSFGSSPAAETVDIDIPAPVVMASPSSVSVTAGATVAVNSGVTVTSADTDVTGATVTITNSSNAFVSGDTLHFTSPTDNVTLVSNTGGVLTLTGTTTPANYALALASITYSNSTNSSTTTRDVTIVVSDSNDTGNVSGSATSTITVNVPITITAAYVSGSAWTTAANTTSAGTEQFDTYLVNHSLGNASIPTVGYALRTGASQTTDIPWVNINTISVSFSSAVSNIGLGSLMLVGGTGGGAVAAPTATGFASDGNNTYSWTFPSNLGNNKYIFAIATTGSSFGTLGSTQVTDASGAGISGTFTTGSSTFPSGNGLAGSTFDFAFSVLPGDGKQGGTVNSSDAAAANATLNDHETTAGYSPYYDYYGAGLVNSADGATAAANLNKSQSGITAPAAPSGEQAGATGDAVGTTGFTALELGVQETGSSTSLTAGSSQTSTATTSTAASAGTPSASPTPAATTSASTGGTVGSGSESTTTTTAGQHGRHQFAVTDEAVSDLDLADLWA